MALAQWSSSPVGVQHQSSQDKHPTFGIEVRGPDATLALPLTCPTPGKLWAPRRAHFRATEVTRERGERRLRKMAELQIPEGEAGGRG